MKFYLFSYLWRTDGSTALRNGTGVHASEKGITGLYEETIRQPENWCLTHVAEITEAEFLQIQKDGIIG